jgi:hypothetical protein
MPAVATQPIPGRPARHEEYDGARSGTRWCKGPATQRDDEPGYADGYSAPIAGGKVGNSFGVRSAASRKPCRDQGICLNGYFNVPL